MRLPVTSGVAGKVIKTGHSISLHGEETQQQVFRKLEEIIGERLRAMLAAPLRLHGELKGVMEAIHSEQDAFDADDLQLLEAAASWVSIALQNAQLFTQVQRSRQRLGRLARKVVTAQEEERQRVSRELHDEAGQALIALKLNLESIRASLPPELEETMQQLTETINWTDETMDEIRMIAHDLRPQVIESLGLNSALDGLCIDFARRTNLSIQYEGVDLPPLPDPVLISYYRFLQEALTNVAKHAGASQVHVALGRSEDSIYLSVTDDGTGFSLNAHRDPSVHSGLGLNGMQERFELLGGWVLIDSRPTQGTRVAAHIPLEPEWEEPKK
jgi:signal transduction histidine kinase